MAPKKNAPPKSGTAKRGRPSMKKAAEPAEPASGTVSAEKVIKNLKRAITANSEITEK